jgi:hypothetical protein
MSNIPEAEVNSLVIGQLIVEPPEVEATFVEVEATSVEFRPGNIFFCSTLSEFENFLLCERILMNLTTCQNETSS